MPLAFAFPIFQFLCHTFWALISMPWTTVEPSNGDAATSPQSAGLPHLFSLFPLRCHYKASLSYEAVTSAWPVSRCSTPGVDRALVFGISRFLLSPGLSLPKWVALYTLLVKELLLTHLL